MMMFVKSALLLALGFSSVAEGGKFKGRPVKEFQRRHAVEDEVEEGKYNRRKPTTMAPDTPGTAKTTKTSGTSGSDDGMGTTDTLMTKSTGTSGSTGTGSAKTSKSGKSEPSDTETISDDMNRDCKCEYYLYDPIYYYLAKYGMEFPSFCCIFAAMSKSYYGPYGVEASAEGQPQVPLEALADIANIIIDNGLQALNVTSKAELEQDYRTSFPEDTTEEFGYGCEYDFLTCKLMYAIYNSMDQGINACYCHYRTTVMCKCSNCTDVNYGIDEKISYYFGVLPGSSDKKRSLADLGLAGTGTGNVDETLNGAHNERELEDDNGYEYVESLIKTCTQCPNDMGGEPYDKCYGYCLILGTFPYSDECFHENYV